MKLLSKTDIQLTKAAERKREVDEGAKLARKVDALRELAAKEQTNLTVFREASIKQVKKEIQDAIEEKNVLLNEIELLKEQRKALQKPLDKEWERLEKEKVKLEVLKEDLSLRKIQIVGSERDLKTLKKEIEVQCKALDKERDQVKSLINQAESIKVEAHVIHKNTTARSEKLQLLQDEREQSVKEREAMVAVREREIVIHEEHLATEQEEINNEKIRLADQRATLERAFERINKNHGQRKT